MAAIRPVAQDNSTVFRSEMATRYGVMMGGEKGIEWGGIGEYAIGYSYIPRRTLTEFNRLQVGRRNESEEALSDESRSLARDWAINPARIIGKSPLACVLAVKETFGNRGFVSPESLIGVDFNEAVRRFEEVLPTEIAQLTLVDVVNHLSSTEFNDTEVNKLRDELLQGAYKAQEWLRNQVGLIKGEREIARNTGRGRRSFDQIETEYFRELKEPLPEEVPALATLAMGRELGQQFAAANQNSKTDQLVEALVEQNRLKEEELKLLREQMKTEPAKPKGKAVGHKE